MQVKLNKIVQAFLGVMLLGVTSATFSQSIFGTQPTNNNSSSKSSVAGVKLPPGVKVPEIKLSSEEDLGCKLLLCLSASNPSQYAECRPPIREMHKRQACLAKGKNCGNPLPTCPTGQMPGGDKMAGTGVEVVDYEDCPAGSSPVTANQLFIVESDYVAAVKLDQQSSSRKKYNPNSTNVGFGDNVLPFNGYPIYEGVGDAKKCVPAQADASGNLPAGSFSKSGVVAGGGGKSGCFAKMCATGASTRKVRLAVTYQEDVGDSGKRDVVKYFDVMVYPSVKAFAAKTRTMLNIKIDGKLHRQVDLNNVSE